MKLRTALNNFFRINSFLQKFPSLIHSYVFGLKHLVSLLVLIALPMSSCADTKSTVTKTTATKSTGAKSTVTKVVGYIAAFNNMRATIDSVDLSKLTHINVSFANPDSNGVFIINDVMTCMPGAAGAPVKGEEIRYLIDKAHKAGVKVLISVAGGVIPACSGDWAVLLQHKNRKTVINNLLKFAEDFKFDGIDIDIEGVLLTAIDKAGDYTPTIKTLANNLQPKGKLLTCATASYEGGMIPVSSIRYFDFVNIMSYDVIGPGWGVAGSEHSSYEKALADVNLWKSRGLPKDKLVLGVPFYGYGFGDYPSDFSIKTIFSQFGVAAESKDLIGEACAKCSYITYNGYPTIKSKTKLALTEGSGVMIWELAQDAAGEKSMLKAIHDEIKK